MSAESSFETNPKESTSDLTVIEKDDDAQEKAGNDTTSKDDATSEDDSSSEDEDKIFEDAKDKILEDNVKLEVEDLLKQFTELKVQKQQTFPQSTIYPASFLKRGLIQGISYQLKILTWTVWNLFKSKKNNWGLAAEVRNARGFHDLVVRYNVASESREKASTFRNRCVQIKYASTGHCINEHHLASGQRFNRQYSLSYLFIAYLDMLRSFTDDQIIDLTMYTNKTICSFPFLIPLEKDEIFGFESKGLRFRIQIDKLHYESKLMLCLRNIKDDYEIIKSFLSKLVLAVDQPSESEIENLIIHDMEKTLTYMPRVFYTDLFKNVVDWFCIYNTKLQTSPYYTKSNVVACLKNTTSMLLNATKAAESSDLLQDCLSLLSNS